jgi:hypothetical protein
MSWWWELEEGTDYLMKHRAKKGLGLGITFEVTPLVTYFLQLVPPS